MPQNNNLSKKSIKTKKNYFYTHSMFSENEMIFDHNQLHTDMYDIDR